MKKLVYVVLSIGYFTSQSLITNSPILLNAQSDWSDDVRIGYLSGGHWYPRAAAWNSTVHLVYYRSWWEEPDTLFEEVYYKRSTDSGNTWEDDVLLSYKDIINSIMPDLAVKGDTVIVAWNDYQTGLLQYRRSTTGGVSWEPIDALECSFTLKYPSIDIIDDTVYIAVGGYVGGEYPVCFTQSINGGATWDSVIQIYDQMSQGPRIAVTWPNVHIVFSAVDPIYDDTEIFYVSSRDGGRTWGPLDIISHCDDIPSQRPFTTSWLDGVAVVWYDYKYSPYMWTGDIFFRRKVDNHSKTWDEIASLTTAHRAVWSDILAERTHLHVVWEDGRNGPYSNFEIYYRESSDYGLTWLPEVKLTDAPYHSYTPALACGGNYLHCFWQDRRDCGNYMDGFIYYKRKDLSHSIEESNKSTIADCRLYVYPNPFKEITDIRFQITDTKNARMEIYDASGRLVKDFNLQSTIPNVQSSMSWGGTDNAGHKLPTGVYFVQVEFSGERMIKKFVKLR